jgi:2-iminobutanoate/2-iminopropanoate deaminase
VTGIDIFSPEGMYRAASYEHVAIAGDFAFIAGQVARDENGTLVAPGDAGAQAAQIFRNLGKILDHLGAAPDQVVRITTLLADLGDSAAVAAERKAFFGEHRPPHTGYAVGLGPQVKVELEFTVYLKPAR